MRSPSRKNTPQGREGFFAEVRGGKSHFTLIDGPSIGYALTNWFKPAVSVGGVSYGWGGIGNSQGYYNQIPSTILPIRISKIDYPSQGMLVSDKGKGRDVSSRDIFLYEVGYWGMTSRMVHGTGQNVVFFDGHSEFRGSMDFWPYARYSVHNSQNYTWMHWPFKFFNQHRGEF